MKHERTEGGWLCGTGLGPGDPDLVTAAALRVIRNADLLMVPHAEGRAESPAKKILAAHMDLGSRSAKDVVYPLSSDRQVKADFWNRTAAYTVDRVHDGVRVAFVTIGDPLVYSTWQHLLRQVVRLDPGLDVRTVPGISSYSLAAALSAVSLAEADGELVVCPAGSEKLETYLRGSACTVVMKIGRRLPELTDLLARTGMVKHSVMVISAGTENQRIVRGGDLLSQPESSGRMAVLIVRPPGQHTGAARHHAEKHRKTPGERTGPESTGTR